MSVPFKVDLSGEVAVVTGAGGVLCSGFAKALAECGAKVAVCDLRADAAQKVADEITAAGGTAAAFEMNVLQKDSIIAAQAAIHEKFGAVTLLLNGAGGNNPKGTTDREYCTPEDIAELEKNGTIEGVKTFFDLDPDGISFVFNLNFLGTLIPTQAFASQMVERDDKALARLQLLEPLQGEAAAVDIAVGIGKEESLREAGIHQGISAEGFAEQLRLYAAVDAHSRIIYQFGLLGLSIDGKTDV